MIIQLVKHCGCFCSVIWLCPQLFETPWTTALQASLSFSISEFAQTHVHWVSDATQPSHPLLPFVHLLSIFPSLRVFSNESVLCTRWSEYWSFSISPSNQYSGLISLRIGWFYFLAVHGALKSLCQHHSSKASILLHSAFFMVQVSHPYMTTGKTIAFTRWTFIRKVNFSTF